MGMAANYGMTSVRFLKSWQGYNAGDVAGFTQATAQRLVSKGWATFEKVEKPAQTVTKAPMLTPKPKRKYTKKKTRKMKPGTYTTKEDLLAAIDDTQKE